MFLSLLVLAACAVCSALRLTPSMVIAERPRTASPFMPIPPRKPRQEGKTQSEAQGEAQSGWTFGRGSQMNSGEYVPEGLSKVNS